MRVGEWSEAVVIFLSGGIPQSQTDRPAVDHHAGRVVVEAVRRSGISNAIAFGRHIHRNLRRGDGGPTRSECTRPERRSLCTRSKDMSRDSGVNSSGSWLLSIGEVGLITDFADSTVTSHHTLCVSN